MKKGFEISIKTEWCKGCGYCVEFCPKHVFAMSEQFNTKGYFVAVAQHPEACTGCRLCEYCPDFAIRINKSVADRLTRF